MQRRRYTPRPELSLLINEAVKSGAAQQLISRLHALRDVDDGDALAVLGVLHEAGLHAASGESLIEPDPKLARQYRDRAAKLGNPPAMTLVADDLAASSSASSRKKAERLYMKAAGYGYGTAAYNLAVTHLHRQQHQKAVAWFRRAAALGCEPARIQLAMAEFHGLGLPRRPSAAIHRLLQLARAANGISDFEREDTIVFVANALRDGWVVRRDYPRALVLLREAADIGSESAKGLLNDLGE